MSRVASALRRALPVLLVSIAALPSHAGAKTVVLPWIAQSRGALVQSSDLSLFNPGEEPISVTLELRKRGAPESVPPRATRTVGPSATLHVPNALDQLFDRENLTGFVLITAPGDAEPVAVSFDPVTRDGAKAIGQLVAGITLPAPGAPVEPRVQHLVGLQDDGERVAMLGIDNPNSTPATYLLRAFDREGHPLGESGELTLGAFRQRQLQPRELREVLGVEGESDYRVEVETHSGGPLVAFASNQDLANGDRAFVAALAAGEPTTHVVGAVDAAGPGGSRFRTDLLLSNPSGVAVTVDVAFTGVGVRAEPTVPRTVDLAAGATERIEDVVAALVGHEGGGVGVVTVTADPAVESPPLVRAETFEGPGPAHGLGTSVPSAGGGAAASLGQGQYLVGLRQDAGERTTLWLFNPTSSQGSYTVVYRALDGTAVGTRNVMLGPGKMRQLSPAQHPFPNNVILPGFTVAIEVHSGALLSGAQVVRTLTNDPAYVQGETR